MNSLKDNIILSLNSDLDMQGTIGARAIYPAVECERKGYLKRVICRDYNKNIKNISKDKIVKKIPFGNLFPRLLTGVTTYLFPNFPSRKIQVFLYELFSLNYVKDAKLIHSWEYSSRMLKRAKKKGMITILDIPIGHAKYFVELKKRHGLTTDRNEIIERNITRSLKYADYIIAPSEFVKETLKMAKVSEKRIFIVPFGVDSKRFRPGKIPKKFRVIFAGNINYRKGIPFLLRAWEELKLKDAELVLCGHIYKSMKPLIREYKKRCKNIITPGFVDVAKEMRRSSIFVFPSLMEGSAKAVYEAMASGLPVITTYNAGSIVRNGKDGFIVPIMDTKRLKEKIKYFYENRKAIEVKGKSARKQAEKYTWQRYGKELVKIYERVAK